MSVFCSWGQTLLLLVTIHSTFSVSESHCSVQGAGSTKQKQLERAVRLLFSVMSLPVAG